MPVLGGPSFERHAYLKELDREGSLQCVKWLGKDYKVIGFPWTERLGDCIELWGVPEVVAMHEINFYTFKRVR